ncbi:thymidylate synthase [bacterium]|nr:thymidylate synthase [bacterium]|tara:strand:+ start:2161 stop:3033 length:873 start_codon:yes stop_codon:yes gene_type:complete
MKSYLDIVQKILTTGIKNPNRTGQDTLTITGAMFEHDMQDGYPLLTTKKVPFRLVASELEFFIKGITDKKWLQDRNNHIWDEWCTPLKIPYANDEDTKKRMLEERDLGTIYGWEWRHFGAEYKSYETDYSGQGVDQLKKLVDDIKNDPLSRRMIVMAWNPMDINKAVPPYCHYGFQVTVVDGKLNLLWNQRSVDTMLGLPFNIASYALMLHLLAKETGLEEGKLVGFLAHTHIYTNHIEGAKEQIARDPSKYPLAKVKTDKFSSIFDWEYTDSEIMDYQSFPGIKFDIAV